jgi:hypothetical protein
MNSLVKNRNVDTTSTYSKIILQLYATIFTQYILPTFYTHVHEVSKTSGLTEKYGNLIHVCALNRVQAFMLWFMHVHTVYYTQVYRAGLADFCTYCTRTKEIKQTYSDLQTLFSKQVHRN